jgi:transposase
VVSVRTAHPLWGGRRIAKELKAQGLTNVPAPSTITSILAQHGLLHQDKRIDRLECLFTDRQSDPTPLWTVQPIDEAHLAIVREHLLSKRVLERRRAIVLLANWRGLRPSFICKLLGLSPVTYRRCIEIARERGVAALFDRRKNAHRKYDNEVIKNTLFDVLHQPPSNFGINRTTSKMVDLSRVLSEKGHPAGEDVIRKITKAAGYQWRKARKVLTSNDPEFSQKLDRIKSILSNLGQDEAFFSIDEYGPFAVKAQPGRSLTAPGEQRLVAQWQKSRGSITLTATIELSSNQISHFYSSKKNTAEMIRTMNVLVDQYRDRRQIYLSWDAASWHVSKELNRHIEDHNRAGRGPIVAVAPLPTRAQFLNVIESVFSGMARAIIHNSDYKSVDEAKAAIDRYFEERNRHFKEHPRKAGNKIWGKERTPAEFSQSNNCKDPRLG